MIPTRSLAALCLAVMALAMAGPATAQDKPLATVNGKAITEADLKFAEEEIGSDLGSLPPAVRRRALIEYLVEHQLLAEAATLQKMDAGAEMDRRMLYLKRKALRDTYFDTAIKGSVSEAEARKAFDTQIARTRPEEEIKASHILVETEAQAKELAASIAHGDAKTFAELARKSSKDPGTRDDGGTLGYFARGQMVPQFEEAAFKLAKGEVSRPIQTQFGWHLIRVDDRRQKKLPDFQEVKDRIVGSMVHQKAQGVVAELRGKAKIDYLDAEVKRQVDDEKAAGGRPKPQ